MDAEEIPAQIGETLVQGQPRPVEGVKRRMAGLIPESFDSDSIMMHRRMRSTPDDGGRDLQRRPSCRDAQAKVADF